MPLEMRKTYQLRTSDFDRYERIKPSAVLDVFQDIAGLHADEIGTGKSLMQSEGVFWAVVRMKYEVLKYPPLHGAVLARTWPHDPTRLIFHRDYTMSDEAGEVLIKASSEWTLMNVRTRALARLSDHMALDGDYCSDRAFEGRVKRVPTFDFDEAPQAVHTLVPHASDVDLNGHVNNARYAAFAFDALDLGEDDVIKTFQIDFKHEVLEGQPLTLWPKRTAEGALVAGTNAAGEVAFACAVTFSR